MPGPIRLFKYFTDAQLQAALDACVSQMTTGAFTALSGAGKSSSVEWLALDTRLQALNYEKDIRNRTTQPKKVVQVLTGNAFGPGFYCGY